MAHERSLFACSSSLKSHASHVRDPELLTFLPFRLVIFFSDVIFLSREL